MSSIDICCWKNDYGDPSDLSVKAYRAVPSHLHITQCSSMTDPDFDTSRENLERLFQLLDSDGSGLLTQSKLQVRVVACSNGILKK